MSRKRAAAPEPTVPWPMDADTFRDLRLGMNVSQTALADRLGVGKTTIQNWERGDRRIPKTAAILMVQWAGGN